MIKRFPTLSFCITCKNRLYQIRNTLGQNLCDNRMHKHLVEFVLIDFASNDGLKEWIGNSFMEEIEQGFLKYYYTEKLDGWNMPLAKNTSHLWANNDILVNLDCDNYTGPDGGAFVIDTFMQFGDDILLHQGNDYTDGSWGRVGMKREFFHAVGGYDEAFKPFLYDDMDIIERLKSLGLKYIHVTGMKYNKTIPNTLDESFANVDGVPAYDDWNESNKAISDRNIADGRLRVNKNHIWGIRDGMFDIYGKSVSLHI